MKPWKRVEPTEVMRAGYRTITRKNFLMPDGEVRTFDIKEAEGWSAVAVIALTKQNEAIVVNTFRPGPEIMMQEIPGGGVEEGEDIQVAAERELREETDYKVGSIAYLGYCHYDAFTNGKRHYFLARDCEMVGDGQKLDAEEFLEVAKVPIRQLIDNAMHGRMTDPGGVLLAYPHLQELL